MYKAKKEHITGNKNKILNHKCKIVLSQFQQDKSE
jgi:hypothetical protein